MPKPFSALHLVQPCSAPKAYTLALCAWLCACSAMAQSPPLQRATPTHTVTEGETLGALALRYLGDANLWSALQKHNDVDSPYRLQQGAVLQIPATLMPAAPAAVDYAQGSPQVQRNGTHLEASHGMPLLEGDHISLPAAAFLTIRLADGSTVRVQADSQLSLLQLRRRGRAGSLQSVLEVQKGGIEVQTPPQPDPKRQLEVLTPVASTSIRGTIFDVQLAPDGSSTTSVVRGRVALQSLADAQETTPTAQLAARTGIAVAANGQAATITPLLPAPALAEMPALNESAHWLDLALPQWERAHAWRVNVSQDREGLQVLRNGQFQAPQARFIAIPDGDYFVQLRGIDAQGIVGLPTTAPLRVKAHPVPPLVQSPAPGGILPQGAAQLHCTPVEGAVSYQHELIAIRDTEQPISATAFAQPLWQARSTTSCEADLAALPPGTYAWRAASVRIVEMQEDQGPFSAPHLLRILPQPQVPLLESATQAGITTLHWSAEPEQRFRLQAFATPDGTNPVLDTVLQAPHWTASDLPAGTWYIRLQAQDPSGLNSAFSPARSIQVLALVRDGFGHPIQSGYGLGIQHD